MNGRQIYSFFSAVLLEISVSDCFGDSTGFQAAVNQFATVQGM